MMGASILTNWRSLHLPRSPKDSCEQDFKNMGRFPEKLGSLSEQGREPPRLLQDQVGMRQQLQEEREEVRARLEPYRVDMYERVGWNLEGLRRQLKPYTTDLMEQVALRVQKLQEQLRLVGEDTKTQVLGGPGRGAGLFAATSEMRSAPHQPYEGVVPPLRKAPDARHPAPHTGAAPQRGAARCSHPRAPQLLSASALTQAHTQGQGPACIPQNLDQLREELSAFARAGTDGTEERADPDPQVLS